MQESHAVGAFLVALADAEIVTGSYPPPLDRSLGDSGPICVRAPPGVEGYEFLRRFAGRRKL